MLARRVKWRNSFRDFEGTVVKVVKDECTVFEFNDLEEYTVAKHHLTLCQPDCCRYASYMRKKFELQISDTAEEDSVHDLVISAIEGLHGDRTFSRSKQDAIKHEIRLKGAAARVHVSSESDNKFASNFPTSAQAVLKSVGKGKEGGKVGAADNPSDKESEEEEEEEEEEEGDDSDAESSESEGSDDSAESSSEEADTSDTGSDSDNEGDDEDEDGDEDEKVDIKIYILPNNDIRGFSVRLTDRGLETIRKALKKDYGAVPQIFFRDSDGDVVAVKSAHDLRYAHRATKAQQGNEGALKVKLFAEVPNQVLPVRLQDAATTSSPSISVDSLSPTVHFVDQARTSDRGIRSSHTTSAGRSGQQSPSLGAAASPGTESLRLEDHDDGLQTSTEAGIGTPTRGAALNFEVLWKRGELLGAGSFGKVYSGLNLSTGERMAVKEVALRRSKKHKQQVQALQLEVKILSSLEHPNIIKYFGTEFTKHTLRIFLELANDGTVKDALNEFGAFPEPLVRRYASDILEGLWFLHSKKFIHRDIKPTNLLVSGGRVKLGDFGCSTTILEDENTLDAGHGTMAGTAVYMAPEVMQVGEDFDIQAITSQQQGTSGDHTNNTAGASKDTLQLKKGLGRRRRGYGKRADVWSVGITLCEMATAKAPFPNAGAAIYAVCVSKKFPSFPDLFSADAHLFMERCLVEDAKARATCSELRLMPFMSEQSVEEARAQTVATLPRSAHTASHVTVHLQVADFSFLKSPSAAYEADQSYHDTLRAAGNFTEKYAGEGARRDGDPEQSSDAFRTAELQRDLFQSSFRSSDIFERYERDRVQRRDGGDHTAHTGHSGAPDASSRWSGSDMDMFRTAASEGADNKYFTARSASQEEDMFERVSTQAEAKEDTFRRTGTTAKECEEDSDCKTGRSTSNSVVGNYRTHW